MSLILRILANPVPSIPGFARPLPRLLAGGLGLALAAFLSGAGPAAAAISGLQLDPTNFSPNGDGIRDTLHIRWATDAPGDSFEVVIRRAVLNTETATVRRVAFPLGFAGAYAWDWDGRDDLGQPVPDGNYRVRIFEFLPSGAAVDTTTALAGLILDTTAPPEPAFDEPWAGRDTTVAEVLLTGIAPAADSVTVFVDGIPRFNERVNPADSSFTAEVPLIEGANAFAVQSFDRAGNRSPLSTAITLTYRNTADITILRARPFFVSPNGDGVLDSARVEIRLDAATTRLLVQVRPSQPFLTGNVLDTLALTATVFDGPAAAGDHVFTWDGIDSTGVPVPDGNWWFTASAESADAAGVPRVAHRFSSGLFDIDRIAPGVPVLLETPPATTTRNFYVFVGRMSGAAESADSVFVFRDGVIIDRSSDIFWDVRVPLTLGSNTFTLQAADQAGNRSPMSAPYTIEYGEPIGFHAPERFRATDVFDVNLTRTGRSVRLDIHELSGRRVRTLAVNQVGNRYELPWNLLDERGITVGNGPYVLRLTVTYDDGVVETRGGAIVVAK